MIRAAALALVLAGPAVAEVKLPDGIDLCLAVEARLSEMLNAVSDTGLHSIGKDGDWCVISGLVIDMPGEYVPDWHMDRLKVRGSALGWIADGTGLPEGLEVVVQGLRMVVQTGNPQMDWLLAAQSRPNAIDAEASLAWDPATKVLRLEGLSVDFPGDNLVQASATVTGVDLSSPGAMQMSLTSFALTELDARITTHGLFEAYALMALGSMMLPPEGDVDAAFRTVQGDLKLFVGDLPAGSFSNDAKAAMQAFVEELPNPSGDLSLAVRADPGFGPVRFGGLAMYGMQDLETDLAPLFQGVTVDVGWSHTDAP